MDGFVSTNGEWAVVPFGKEYMIIHNGKQDSVHKTIEEAKNQIKLAKSKTGTKGKRVVRRASKIKGLEEFME
jgi:hypothetical protein